MKITIRKTLKADLPKIFQIHSDPLVVPFQYKLRSDDTIESWVLKLEGREVQPRTVFKSTTVCLGREIVGHIIQHHYEIKSNKYCYCGWNIAPSHWGKGIATEAIRQQFELFFGQEDIDAVFSDCFSTNMRCLRLIQRLGYESIEIRLGERLWTMIKTGSFRRVLRFCLTREQWNASKIGQRKLIASDDDQSAL